MPTLVLLLPVASYRNEDFLAAARALNVDVIEVQNYCHQLAPTWGMGVTQSVPFDQPERACAALLPQFRSRTVDAVLAVDDSGTELAALLARALGVRGNAPNAVRTLRDKLAFRQLQHAQGFSAPDFRVVHAGTADAIGINFPVVVKARRLSASRGVIRADTPEQLRAAIKRVAAIQAHADRDAGKLGVIVEDFIPGAEFAFEGLLDDGELATLALFEKPDPLDGPYFEETLYIAPARLDANTASRLETAVAAHCHAAGLRNGPVHAEARINDDDIVLLEVAPRSIGGLCGRVLRHSLKIGLEEVILRNALGMQVATSRSAGAVGVMMIPIPKRGVLTAVDGVAAARAVDAIEDCVITAEIGQVVIPPPEGASYLGFIFARAETPVEVEAALRAAHAQLRFDIVTEYPLAGVSG